MRRRPLLASIVTCATPLLGCAREPSASTPPAQSSSGPANTGQARALIQASGTAAGRFMARLDGRTSET
jgi:hypothetical protein